MSALPQNFGVGSIIILTDGPTITIDNGAGNTPTSTGTNTAGNGNYFAVTLGGNRTFATFLNFPFGAVFYLDVVQDGTGSRTATWPSNVAWAAGTAPTLTTTAGATDVVRFTYNTRLSKWIGETVGKAFA